MEALSGGWVTEPPCFSPGTALSCIYGWNHVMPPLPMVIPVALGVVMLLSLALGAWVTFRLVTGR